MRLGRAARLSLRALSAHRARSALAVASVAMGVTGVLLTSAVGKGAEREVRREIDAAGSNLLVVRPAQVKSSAARKKVKGAVTTLRLDDYEAIAALAPAAQAAPGVDGSVRVRGRGGSMVATVVGTAPAVARIRNLRLGRGRFFDEDDDAEARRVAVLGARLARTLFPNEDAVGAEVRLRDVPFEVVGVLEATGLQADGSDQDGNVFVPVRTALRRVFNTTWLGSVSVAVDERARMRAVEADVRGLLRERHRLRAGAADDFAIQDQTKVLAMQQDAIALLTLLTAGLAAVAMVVGGSGILALMWLSVKERTAEIGLRMAVGARPVDVLAQFLGEATLLALGGWATGAAMAVAGGAAVALGTEWRIAFPTEAVLASLLMALATGLGAGVLPARRASRLPPIHALGTAG